MMMKILLNLILSLTLLLGMAFPVYAVTCDNNNLPQTQNGGPDDRLGTIDRPCELSAIEPGAKGISQVLSNAVKIVYGIAGVIFLFMMISGAIGWMTSGGSKEGLDSARKRILAALVGFVLLAAAALVANVIGILTGFGNIVT